MITNSVQNRQTINVLLKILLMMIIIVIISGSTDLVRTLNASHRKFRNLFRHLVGLLWTSDRSARRKGLYVHRTTQHRHTRCCNKLYNCSTQKKFIAFTFDS
jgi:hypothetical protein